MKNDYTFGCLLDYFYCKNHCKIIAIDLCKQQNLHADPKALQKINFIRNLEQAATMLFILKKVK